MLEIFRRGLDTYEIAIPQASNFSTFDGQFIIPPSLVSTAFEENSSALVCRGVNLIEVCIKIISNSELETQFHLRKNLANLVTAYIVIPTTLTGVFRNSVQVHRFVADDIYCLLIDVQGAPIGAILPRGLSRVMS